MQQACDEASRQARSIEDDHHSAQLKREPLRGKGMELYCWRPGGADWHFRLIYGTNRCKTISEITDPSEVIVGVPAVKARLARLAEGEWVTWTEIGSKVPRDGASLWQIQEQVPRDMVDELMHYCKSVGVHLSEPLNVSKQDQYVR